MHILNRIKPSSHCQVINYKDIIAWVTNNPDSYLGWNEIHPAWQIEASE
jgi:hypothetical protein